MGAPYWLLSSKQASNRPKRGAGLAAPATLSGNTETQAQAWACNANRVGRT